MVAMNAGVHLDAYPSYRANSVTDQTRLVFVLKRGDKKHIEKNI